VTRALRVALACPGVGLSQRGFERMFLDLFHLIEPDLDVTLFKGGGAASAREIVPFFLPRNGRFLRYLPIHELAGRTPIHAECMTFALALLPHLRGGAFDVVHTIDPPLTRMLYKLRRRLGLEFKLLYTHGVTMPPSDYPPADYLQHVAEGPHLECLNAGIRDEAMEVVACGFYPERFDVERSRAELRREHGIADDTFVILSIAALNRAHKRSHHLIDEVAHLKGDFLLWLDASMDQGEPDLVEYAQSRLGSRLRLTHVPSDRVGELYRMADILAHASTFESFGLAIVEAASTGLPVLIHDAPHFRWLLPNPRCWVDMTEAGALARRLAALMQRREDLAGMRSSELVRERFSWSHLRPAYKTLYERTNAMPKAGRADGAPVNYFWQLHG